MNAEALGAGPLAGPRPDRMPSPALTATAPVTETPGEDRRLLLLFDIDGTLLRRASSEHALALRQALTNVHRLDGATLALEGSMAGRTDGEIARLMLLGAGIAQARIDELAAEVRAECCRLYVGLCPDDLSAKVTPGMRELLEWLSRRDSVQLALLTGNFEPVARVKLRAAGLAGWFEQGQGGFGSDSEDRTLLPALARRRAGEAAGLGGAWPRERTLVIGDTPRDIACAHADGVRCVAVTSGPYDTDALSDSDATAQSTDELRAIVEAMISVG